MCPLFLFVCICLLSACGSAVSSSNTVGVQNPSNSDVQNRDREDSKRSTNSTEPLLTEKPQSLKRFDFGCWLGEKGGGLRIDNENITHYDEKRGYAHKYRLYKDERDPDQSAIVLELDRTSDTEFLSKFVSIRFMGEDDRLKIDKILVYGFDSYDNLLASEFSSAGLFYKADCEKDLHVHTP